MSELDLDALRWAVEKGRAKRSKYVASEGQAQADWVSRPGYRSNSWVGDLGVGLSQAEAILTELERIPELERQRDQWAEEASRNQRHSIDAQARVERVEAALAAVALAHHGGSPHRGSCKVCAGLAVAQHEGS
jgi:hypothetical protein